jgi:alpha-galactosidase
MGSAAGPCEDAGQYGETEFEKPGFYVQSEQRKVQKYVFGVHMIQIQVRMMSR